LGRKNFPFDTPLLAAGLFIHDEPVADQGFMSTQQKNHIIENVSRPPEKIEGLKYSF